MSTWECEENATQPGAIGFQHHAFEFSEFFKEQYYPWFARYLVMKRASIEPNFHDLYLKFLDKVNSKPLNKEIVQGSAKGSELIKSSSEERSLLKNLGSWLGKITIGRNQVLRAREIDPKTLIIEVFFCSRASFEAVISLYK
ncbi:hypothetical protein POM88_045247 [Heracleum sosnowskyi]|uniref:CCR4-NOT transcription complex subunit 1 CAF1-binding domain-containing protein n=1 Tax=Heracleum sosnowskyi TaxID=360622 RepID=A0AAD8H640_9APIA|nr:hypothetical protein POM88_045247 [Heracleum sosnowskyi]